MKTTLTLLIATLIFVGTPMLASASGKGHHDDGPRYYKSWDKGHHDQRHDDRYDHKRKLRLKHELRETRRELYQVKRQIRHDHRHDRYHQHYYAGSGLIIGIPNVVLRFGW